MEKRKEKENTTLEGNKKRERHEGTKAVTFRGRKKEEREWRK